MDRISGGWRTKPSSLTYRGRKSGLAHSLARSGHGVRLECQFSISPKPCTHRVIRRRVCCIPAAGDSEGVLDSPPKQITPTIALEPSPLPATAAAQESEATKAAAEASAGAAQPASENSIRTLNADIAEIAIPTLIALAADPIAGWGKPGCLIGSVETCC